MRTRSPKNPAPAAPAWWRSPFFLGCLLAAALFRLAGILSLASDPRVAQPILDGKYYMELARRLASGQGWPTGPIFMTPFYPWALGLIFRVASPVPLTGQIFQALLGLATLTLLTAAARRDFGDRPAWTLAGLYVLCGPVLGIESQILTESLLLFLAASALYLWPARRDRWWRLLLFGVATGLLTTGRGVFLLLPLAAVGHLWLRERGAGRGNSSVNDAGRNAAATRGARPGILPPHWLLKVALVSSGLVLALLPLAVRQISSTSTFQLLTLNGGMNLYIGNNPYARGIYNLPPEIDLEKGSDFTAAHSASVLAGHELNLVESNRFWTHRALDFLIGNPQRAAWLLGRKALLFFSPREIPQIEDFQILRSRHLPLRVALVDFGWIFPLAVLGAFTAIRRMRRKKEEPAAVNRDDGRQLDGRKIVLAPWLILIAVGWVSTILFFFTGRYRIPFLAGFLGPAALGAAVVVEMIRFRRARLELTLLPVAVVVQLLLPGYSAEKAEAYDHYQAGHRLAEAGQAGAALEEYRQAIKLQPDDGKAWHGSGAALVNLHRLPEAAQAYHEAIVRMPNSALTHYNLGIVYGMSGNDSLALGELRTAAKLDPYDARIRSDLGVSLARCGHLQEAAQEFRETLRLDPGNGPALQMLQKLEEGR